MFKKHRFFFPKVFWDFQKWTKKMSKNRFSKISLRKNMFCDDTLKIWSDGFSENFYFVTINFFIFSENDLGDFLYRIYIGNVSYKKISKNLQKF